MRLCALILFCIVLVTTCQCNANPDPKKYKGNVKDKDKLSNTTLTADEKKFIKEVEEKFGIKNDASTENKKNDTGNQSESLQSRQSLFPAVIAIEIVNDTDSKYKGKRTIDANLGYGYKTNAGYTYSYFGKPAQEQGKFMIYPYSQEDIPAQRDNTYHNLPQYDQLSGRHLKTSVQIEPSQAFELVPVSEEKSNYDYRKPSIQFNTPYEDGQGMNSEEYSSGHNSMHGSDSPSTLYTTYNGEQFTGVSGQFPSVMENYFVEPSQLLKSPEYQNVGLSQDHLRSRGSHLEQKVVPVLVLRVPSSSLRNPSNELYANLPHNYPLSNYLNNLNLQQLVNQYYKKNRHGHEPKIIYTNSHSSNPIKSSLSSSLSQYEPQHYAQPYIQPSYTQVDHSGVQYSAVQPVMARYPSSYVHHHYMPPKGYSLYKQSLQPKYEYRYPYVMHAAIPKHKYYYQQHYQQQPEQDISQEVEDNYSSLGHGTNVHNSPTHYEVPSHVPSSHQTSVTSSVEFGISHPSPEHEGTVTPTYGHSKEEFSQTLPVGYNNLRTAAYEAAKQTIGSQEHYSHQQDNHKQTVALVQPGHKYESHSVINNNNNYVYQEQGQEDSDKGLILSENYPSKDHTIATVLPSHYKAPTHNTAVQTVSYVTPMPFSSKYKIPFNVIVPQTFLYNPTTEKVAYVHSHSMPSPYSQTIIQQEHNPEEEYTVGYHYNPPVGKQKPSSYPRNHHSHPKRMVMKETGAVSLHKNKNIRTEKRRP